MAISADFLVATDSNRVSHVRIMRGCSGVYVHAVLLRQLHDAPRRHGFSSLGFAQT